MEINRTSLDGSPGIGRPRDPRIDAAILRATADLLVEIGYANLTMAAVAERAATTKTALYRRWSSKAELVYAAAAPGKPISVARASDDIVTDLRMIIDRTRATCTSPVARAALPGLVVDMATDPSLKIGSGERIGALIEGFRARLALGVQRGEVRADVDAERLTEVIGGATLMRVMLRPGEPIEDDWVDQIVAILTHGVVT